MKHIVLTIKSDTDYSGDVDVDIVLSDLFDEDDDIGYSEAEAKSVIITNNILNADKMLFLFPGYTTEMYIKAQLGEFTSLFKAKLDDYFQKTFFENNYMNGDADVVVAEIKYLDNVETVECWHCGISHVKTSPDAIYDYPSDKEPTMVHFCSWYCYDSIKGLNYSRDFNYRECDCCGRLICEQSPSNGYLWQFHNSEDDEFDYDGDGMICNECHRQKTFKNGISEEMLKDGHIQSDWHDTSELRENGFEIHESFRVTNIEEFYNQIQSLFESNLVIVENGRLSILGDEGYVTVWIKPKVEIPDNIIICNC